MAMLADLDKDTVDFKDNYDGKEQRADRPAGAHPQPAGQRLGRHRRRHGHQHPAAQPGRDRRRLPGDDRRSRRSPLEALLDIVPGPDFPTGGEIIGRTGARQALLTGRGSVIVRGAADDRGDPQGPRGDHHHLDALSGEQGGAGRADRRAGAREAHRGHRRPARRERPPGHARGDRAEARRLAPTWC